MAGETAQVPAFETDTRFPSGPWTGFFVQSQRPPGRHWMDLQLTFRDSLIRGDGRDWVGKFIITGHYQLVDGRCWWTKKYLGKHDVFYKGYNEGRGIWGTWEIPPLLKGGFHIWPLGTGDASASSVGVQNEEPEWAGAESLEPADVVAMGGDRLRAVNGSEVLIAHVGRETSQESASLVRLRRSSDMRDSSVDSRTGRSRFTGIT